MNKAWRYLCLKIITDTAVINVSFVGAFLAKYRTSQFLPVLMIYYKPLLFITVLWLVVLNLAGLYKLQPKATDRIDNIFSVSFGVFSAAFFTYVIIIFLYREASYSKDIVILGSFFALALINLSRFLIWKLYQR